QWQPRKSIVNLVKEEWEAWRLRSAYRKEKLEGNNFKNWGAIWHYFYLYCVLYKKTAEDADWIDFCTWSKTSKHFIARKAHQHFIMMNNISDTLQNQQTLRPIDIHKMYFVGEGTHIGEIGKNIKLVPYLDPMEVYQVDQNKICFIVKKTSL